MVCWRTKELYHKNAIIEDLRKKMIDETNVFLTWALAEDRQLPRIPRRCASRGGFGAMMRLPGARAAVERWWDKTLDLIPSDW